MSRREYTLVDVFTDRKFGGNQLAVFPDGRGVSDELMLAAAKELNLSETTFVVPAEHGGDHRIRIFTTTRELPFAGHPTIGTAFVLAHARDATLRLEEPVGTLQVTLRDGFAEMEQPLPHSSPSSTAMRSRPASRSMPPISSRRYRSRSGPAASDSPSSP